MCEILGQPHWCSQNSISRIKILIFDHHLAGALKSYYETPFIKIIVYYNFLLTKTPSTIKYIMNILFIIKCHSKKNKKTDSDCPTVIFLSLCFSLPHFDKILHIAVIMIFI